MAKNNGVLIIAEKPTAAKAISVALAEGKPVENVTQDGVKWYEFKRNGVQHTAVAAVGHLFTLKQKKGSTYPTAELEWVPTYIASKMGAFSKRYFEAVAALSGRKWKKYVAATDYDVEGEVIAANVLRLMFNQTDAGRMKFSTMTKDELIESYEKMSAHMNSGMVESGLTRHYLDHIWGVSLSRALMAAIKSAGRRFRIMSTGRVQGPILHMLAKHEKKIAAFKSTPFWQIEADIAIGDQVLKAEFEKDKLWEKSEADKILKAVNMKTATIRDIKKKQLTQRPPRPYNTTSMLADIYRFFGYSPAQGMIIAEALYQSGLISYPRTSSEKLPKDINYKKIISGLGKQKPYEKSSKDILGKSELKPEEGSKMDPAHPAVYPTGELPKKIGDHQRKVYDLVVRRFLAAFGEPAKRESQRVVLALGEQTFYIAGVRTLEPGWMTYYGRYAAREETILPDLNIGEHVKVKNVEQLAKQTQPPARYSQGSVLKEMEQRGLGTKATRSGILQTLYNRGYLIGKSIEVTELGQKLSDILEKNASDIVSEKLTRHFEQECESVESGKAKREAVVDEAKVTLGKILKQFKTKEKVVGKALTDAIIESQEKQSHLGVCPRCGGTIRMHRLWSTKKRFAGCTGYPKCDFSAPLPTFGFITPLEKTCEHCKTPIVQVQRPGLGRPFRMCLDVRCPTKKDWFDKSKLGATKKAPTEAEAIAQAKQKKAK